MGYVRLSQKEVVVKDQGLNAEDAESWYIKYRGQRDHATERGLKSELTFEDYLTKAQEAGITSPEQIGPGKDKFVLGRHGDVGNYTGESCRFIPSEQNLQESHENGRRALAGQKCAITITGRTKENNPGTAAQAEKLAKNFVMIDPTGTVYRGSNLFEFCGQHGLDARAMYGVFSGRRPHHKQWTGRYE